MSFSGDQSEGSVNARVVAAFGACAVVRRAGYALNVIELLLMHPNSQLAFSKHGRSTISTDMVAELGAAFSSLFPESAELAI
jgi:hypothetical protein